MRDLLPELGEWLERGESIALASVISTWGSAPRGVGSYMAINAKEQMIGSVSGGCVEGAVIERAKEVLRSGKAEYLHFGVADETAWDVGLACGGKIDVFVQRVNNDAIKLLVSEINKDFFVSHNTVVNGPADILGSNIVASDNKVLFTSAALQLNEELVWGKVRDTIRKPAKLAVEGTDLEIFFNPILPSPTLVIIGGVQIAIALTKLAELMHFRPIIIDPRRAFLNVERFGDNLAIKQMWPGKAYEDIPLNRATAVASLTHDPKIDDPALIGALGSEAFYVGALGSKKTHQRRLKRLGDQGVSADDLARIQGPIGLDIGADNPEEIALAIMGQVIQSYRN